MSGLRKFLSPSAVAIIVVLGIVSISLPQDWIESTLGISPDGGTGILEMFFTLIPVVCLALWVIAKMLFLAAKGKRGPACRSSSSAHCA